MKYQYLLPLAVVLTAAQQASGSGFQVQERSAVGLGRAFSGEAAMADDASVIASNPAGMTLLEDEWSFAIGATGIFPDVDISGTLTTPAGTRGAVADGVAGDAVLPYFYLSKRLNEHLVFGFGSYTTFGLRTDYQPGFGAGALADFSELVSFNLNPSLAWKINDQWSVGLGFDALYADGKLTSTIPPVIPLLDLRGDDWGYGFNVGVLFELCPETRFGLHYRSGVDLKLEGRSAGAFPTLFGPATLAVDLPDTVEFSAVHDMGDWSIHGDVMWTNWSKFQQLAPQVIGSPGAIPPTIENWDDSWRFALGTTWRATETWTFRAGLAYDLTPVPDANRTLRIPDADRYWLSVGFSWEFAPCWTLDAGYAHLFSEEVFINESSIFGNFRGGVSGSADLVSVGISTEF